MLEIFPSTLKINFKSKFGIASVASGVVIALVVVLLFTKGLNYGVDFRGGAEIQVKFDKPVDLGKLRDSLEANSFKGDNVQSIGEPSQNEFLIKVLASESNLNQVSAGISAALQKDFKDQGVTIRKTDIVGPKAGKELRTSAFKALFYAMVFIMIYIGLRFDFRYAPGVALSLIHDATFVIGFWILTQMEFTLQIVAALLAIIGYSVNDTVVIYDRVREHEQKNPELPLMDILDSAINETLSRTILTAGATFLVCLAMFLWGGDSIRDFFLAMCVGILIGTYSSIFVATPLTLYIDRLKRKVS